jgi:hypothetical protein
MLALIAVHVEPSVERVYELFVGHEFVTVAGVVQFVPDKVYGFGH